MLETEDEGTRSGMGLKGAAEREDRVRKRKSMVKYLAFLLMTYVALGTAAGSVRAWAGVCWSPHAEHFEERAKLYEFTYSRANYFAVRSVHAVGKPAYVAGSKLGDVAFDAVTGLGGGPWGVVAAVLAGQGQDAAMRLVGTVLRNPEQLAAEIGGRTMEKGIAALRVNYRMHRQGLVQLSEDEKQRFRENQVYVDLLGPAKALYLAAEGHGPSESSIGDLSIALAAVQKTLSDSGAVGAVLTAAELRRKLANAGVDLGHYAPYREYERQLALVRKANGITPCQDGIGTERSAETVLDNNALPPQSKRKTYTSMAECADGAFGPCRQFCFATCDHNEDGAISGGSDEGRCHQECNRDCERLCIIEPSVPEEASRHIEAYVNGQVHVSGILQSPVTAALDNAGFRLVAPDGADAACFGPWIDARYGCHANGRNRWPTGGIEDALTVRTFSTPGRYRLVLDASRSPGAITLRVASGYVGRGSSKGSQTRLPNESFEFENMTVEAGEMVVLREIIILDE